jgi:signal transduction histidine kinase
VSENVEVKFQRFPDLATLEIQDFGKGLPQPILERFQRTGTASGVGLAGIRERVKEVGGDFTICSSSAGTTLRSSVPLTPASAKNEATLAAEAKDLPAIGKQRHTPVQVSRVS